MRNGTTLICPDCGRILAKDFIGKQVILRCRSKNCKKDIIFVVEEREEGERLLAFAKEDYLRRPKWQ